ncbi:MAG: hypothetical protein HGA22_13080 [Clostridiales bacterium]|nr:hypothetical protein [Clostridiales bacterium]
MSGEKRFGTSAFGFDKADVNSYIEKILREFDDKLKEKDDEIAILKNQVRESKAKYEELFKNSDQVKEDRVKISNVLIKAQEQADSMIEAARQEAMEEKKQLESMVEKEKEALVDIKQEIKSLKSQVVETLKKFDAQLGEIVTEDGYNS